MSDKILIHVSSSDEFDHERQSLDEFIELIDERLFNDETRIRILDAGEGAIKDSTIFYMLVGKDISNSLKAEFHEATDAFNETGLPKVLTFFKDIEDDKRGDSVRELISLLDSSFGHYYSFFSQPDSLKLNLLLELSKINELVGKLSLKDGNAYVGSLPLLDVSDIPLYAKNKELERLREEYKRDNDEYLEALQKSADADAATLLSVVGPVSKKREDLLERIHELEFSVLNLYRKISSPENRSTWRTREASRLLDGGDYLGALGLLEDEEREVELTRALALKDEGVSRIKDYIVEENLKIAILQARGLNQDIVQNIIASYERIYPLVTNWRIGLGTLFEYARFLRKQNDFAKAIVVAEELFAIQKAINETSESQCSLLYNLLGTLYLDSGRFNEAEKLYLKAIDINRTLSENNPDTFLPDVALNAFHLANFYLHRKDFDKAENLYLEALEIYRTLVERYHNAYLSDLSRTAGSLALLYKITSRSEEAINLYREALSIHRDLAEKDTERYLPDVASNTYDLALLFRDISRIKEAEDLHLEALEIYRTLVDKHPDAYLPALASCTFDLKILYEKNGHYEEAEKLNLEALCIYRILAEKNPDNFLPNVAMSALSLAVFCHANKSYEEAEKLNLEALDIFCTLSKKDPDTYLPDVAMSKFSLGDIYQDKGNFDHAEKLFLESLDIHRDLAKKNPDVYLTDVAMSASNLADLYVDVERFEEAKTLYNEALDSCLCCSNASLATKIANRLALVLDKLGQKVEVSKLLQEVKR